MRAVLDRPELVAHRIINDSDDDSARLSQRNGNRKMRDAVEEIDGAIDRIDDPLEFTGRVALNAFLAIDRVRRKAR